MSLFYLFIYFGTGSHYTEQLALNSRGFRNPPPQPLRLLGMQAQSGKLRPGTYWSEGCMKAGRGFVFPRCTPGPTQGLSHSKPLVNTGD
jgi:hypothetical protein